MADARKVLVTGSSGHLGAALMLALPSLGYTPVGLDIKPDAHLTHYTGSVNDRQLIRTVIKDNGINYVIHTAALHKPHIESHTKEEFVATNVTGTLVILEEAAALFPHQVSSFIFLSTTSTFGNALSPAPGQPAAWIDESVVPEPKNIYGVTKIAAEDLCQLIHQQTALPIIVLRTSRFFPEQDDDDDRRNAMPDDNLKVLELAYRRCDIEDIVLACRQALRHAQKLGFKKYIISAPPPFRNDREGETLAMLDRNPREILEKVTPAVKTLFAQRNWKHLDRIDRVYDSSEAVKELGWDPVHTFSRTLERLCSGGDETWQSELAKKVGARGYHAQTTGVYTCR